MNRFWVIDRLHVMHNVTAANKEAAIEKHNDKSTISADLALVAERHPTCGRLMMPNLPEWMKVTLAHGVIAVPNTAQVYRPNEHGNPEPEQVNVAADNSKFFEHRKLITI